MKKSILILTIVLLFVPVHFGQAPELWRDATVIRTTHGVPHIRAKNLRAAGYALAWLQCEDYGTATPMRLLEASGRAASVIGYERIEADMAMKRLREQTEKNYPTLSRDVRDVYEGFAAGVNRYIELNPERFPANTPKDFTGIDVISTETMVPPARKIRAFLNRLNPRPRPDGVPADDPTTMEEGEGLDDGSNAWAFAPSRTRSGKAILMRNPHLAWSAGYYEAQVTVPGVMDFYGDFRIGGPFVVIGGFNKDLGWSTTNNQQDMDEFYALDVDPNLADHYMFDGRSVAMKRELVTVPFRNGDGISTETREFWTTDIGPVVHRANGKVYVYRTTNDGEFRAGEQFLRMMRAKSFAEWKDAMRMQARATSNFTYADRAGNIFLVWVSKLPILPKPPGDDLSAVPARGAADVFSKIVPFDELPQFHNPPGGYVHNENSSPHYTNVRGGVNTTNRYPNFEQPRLSLRSQLALQLIDNDEKYSLEDVVKLKHNYRALLADRVKPDLIAAVKAANPTGDTAAAIELLERWDNTTAPDSRGSVIFQEWWRHYSGIRGENRQSLPDDQRYAKVWSVADPFNTPSGLADKARAVESFAWAVEEVRSRYGSFDVAWGDVHRVRRGEVDVPVGGCGNDLGCFRIMTFNRDKDGKMAAAGGDGWVFAVEFGDVPRGYSVLAYGQSRSPESPYYSDQAAMFARGEMKPIAFTEKDIKAAAVETYKPGEKK